MDFGVTSLMAVAEASGSFRLLQAVVGTAFVSFFGILFIM
jgi:hypothetical protein